MYAASLEAKSDSEGIDSGHLSVKNTAESLMCMQFTLIQMRKETKLTASSVTLLILMIKLFIRPLQHSPKIRKIPL